MSITSPRPSRAAQCRVIAQDRSIDISPLVNPKSESGYLGVSLHHRGKMWLAKIKADGELFRVGRAPSPEGAARILASYYRGLYGEDWPKQVQARKRPPHRVWEDGAGWRASIWRHGIEIGLTSKEVGTKEGELSPGLWVSRERAREVVKMALDDFDGMDRADLVRS